MSGNTSHALKRREKKELCPGTLFFMGLVVTLTKEVKMGASKMCFYMVRGCEGPLCVECCAGDIWNRSLPLAKSGKGRSGTIGAKLLGTTQGELHPCLWLPASAQDRKAPKVRVFLEMQRIWKATAATCCAILLLNPQTHALSNVTA